MAIGLTKQYLTIPFSGGISTKLDDKQLPSFKMSSLENVIFTKLKRMTKRNGYTALARTLSSSTPDNITAASALTSFNEELVSIARYESSLGQSRLFSYSEGSASWTDKGDYTPCSVSSHPVNKGAAVKKSVTATANSLGVQVFAWEEGGNVRYSAVDANSGQVMIASGLVSTAAAKPVALVVNSVIVVTYISTADNAIYARFFNISPTVSPGAPVQLTATIALNDNTLSSSKPNYEILPVDTVIGPRIFMAFSNDAGGLTVRSYDAASSLASYNQQTVSAYSPDCIACCSFLSGRVGVVFSVGANVYQVNVTALGFSVSAVVTIGTSALGSFIALACSQPTSSSVSVFASSKNTVSNTYKTTIFSIDNTSTLSSLDVLGVSACSRSWLYSERSFVSCCYISKTTGTSFPLQNQVFVLSDNTTFCDVVARAYYGSASGVPSSSLAGSAPMPAVFLQSSSIWTIPVLEAVTIPASNGDIQTTFGVSSFEIDFADAPVSDNRSEIGGSLILGGGIVSQYDGQKNVELGFSLWPDETSVVLGAGGSLSAGSYQWVACYEWTDQNGYIHRSAASLPVSATASAGQSATVTVSNLTITKKNPAYGRENCSIVLYRTIANGTIFYRASSLSAPTSNSVSSFTSAILDTLSDTDLQSRPLLYSTGGAVENIVAAPLKSLAMHRGRLFGIDSTNPLQIWFSKQISPNAPVEFSDSFGLMIDNRGGPITALASLDDKLIIFKKSLIMMLSGQGPDALGNQNDFSDAMLVTSDCGCIDSRSVVTVPDGLMFQSSKGIYLLDRSLRATYIGADVEKYNDNQVVSSQLIPTTNQVRFVTDSGIALVYDYFVQQWSVFTNHTAVDTVIWLDRFCWLKPDGTAMREDPSRKDDNGQFVQMSATTAWINFAVDSGSYIEASEGRLPMALQSFQRAYKMMIIGEYVNQHKLRVRISYDYDDTTAQDVTVEAPQMADPVVYGESSPYGSEALYGGSWQLYQWRIDFARQKCQAVKVTINDSQDGGVASESCRLSAMTFELGLKPGMNRIAMSSVLG